MINSGQCKHLSTFIDDLRLNQVVQHKYAGECTTSTRQNQGLHAFTNTYDTDSAPLCGELKCVCTHKETDCEIIQ